MCTFIQIFANFMQFVIFAYYSTYAKHAISQPYIHTFRSTTNLYFGSLEDFANYAFIGYNRGREQSEIIFELNFYL